MIKTHGLLKLPGLAITLNKSQKGSAPPFIPPQWLHVIDIECLLLDTYPSQTQWISEV